MATTMDHTHCCYPGIFLPRLLCWIRRDAPVTGFDRVAEWFMKLFIGCVVLWLLSVLIWGSWTLFIFSPLLFLGVLVGIPVATFVGHFVYNWLENFN